MTTDESYRGTSQRSGFCDGTAHLAAGMIGYESLTGNKCLIDTFDRNFKYSVEHVALAKRADIVVIAPASANVIGKIACGIADDMLTTTVMACPLQLL